MEAEKYRDLGNKMFKQQKYFEALVNFNKQICHAETDSPLISLAYSNRSVVYLELKEYEKCLENIQLAREAGFPEKKLEALYKREQICKKEMKHQKPNPDDEVFFKLSYPSNVKLPFIVNCLQLKEDDTFGRHIVTSQDLKPGDIIAIEETPFKVLTEAGRYTHCANCFKSNKLTLLPIDNCANGKMVFFLSKIIT